MRIMFYSQHVLGIGHFFRSMEIVKALHRHEVVFIEGGIPLENFSPPVHVRRVLLPPLMMDVEFKGLDLKGGNLAEIKEKRKRVLFECFQAFNPHILITELFPFGRKQFRFELIPILERIRKERLPTRVVCSLRDILVEKADPRAYEESVIAVLNEYYHLLLVHSDPRITFLEETFEHVGRISIPIRYTGFVAKEPPIPSGKHTGKRIVASSGGGKVGVDLLASAIKAVQSLQDHDLVLKVFTGPFLDPEDKAYLSGLASMDRRTMLHPFSMDFLSELVAADLSISMAGYNTCMDIISTGVKALVYPFPQNREQRMRAEKLESLGILKVLRSLDVSRLASCIRKDLESPPLTPLSQTLDLSGAKNTVSIIEGEFLA